MCYDFSESFHVVVSNIIAEIQNVGHDKNGVPIGLQLIGHPWGEATILGLAFAVEQHILEVALYVPLLPDNYIRRHFQCPVDVGNTPDSNREEEEKTEKTAAEVALIVEHLLAELEVTAEEDAELNRQSKTAINKLKKLPLLIGILSKKQLQQEFLDHGVLTLLKNWLEPLPDGSLPNINIRTAILQILSDFPIDLEQYDRRDQLKKVVLKETTSNRKLAKELVDKWVKSLVLIFSVRVSHVAISLLYMSSKGYFVLLAKPLVNVSLMVLCYIP
ncbi:protein IWS1 homolog 1-like [Aristolochia californica]|uniref:protein IWS1 homolog 1-like n=1 Tax=Aristolochia californica TaxID=171875 RepID=UPI0035D6EC74